MGAYDFLPKPFTPGELRMIIDRGFERWRLAQEAKLLRKQKEEVERKFVTLVSHQLKAPLGAVKQYLDVLLHTSRNRLPEDSIEWISRSQARIAEMIGLIQDWLMLAKVEKGALSDRSACADLVKIVENVIQEYKKLPSTANLSLNAEIAPDIERVRGDETSLNMLVGNLVSNAVKYNRPGGSINIRIGKNGNSIRFEVQDTGIGIPASFRPHLFEEFYRVKSPETQNIPGTGLGLVICKKIVDELGGSIEVDSKEGEYSLFSVQLPICEAGEEIEGADAG
jgi:two-component system, sensor histidine kinase and response regulator